MLLYVPNSTSPMFQKTQYNLHNYSISVIKVRWSATDLLILRDFNSSVTCKRLRLIESQLLTDAAIRSM